MTEQDITPAESSFDELARGVGDGSLSRRRALALVGSSIFGGALGSLSLLGDADAADKKKKRKRKKKKKKKQQQNKPPAPAPLGAITTCTNLGTACGLGANTLICNCRLTKEGTQTCANVVNPPNGVSFNSCNLSSDCPAGQICDFGGNVCRSTCQTA